MRGNKHLFGNQRIIVLEAQIQTEIQTVSRSQGEGKRYLCKKEMNKYVRRRKNSYRC